MSWAVGGIFALLGLLMVGGTFDESGSFDWGASVIGAFCLLVGLGSLYAFAWLPKVWFDEEALHVRQLGENELRATTCRIARSEVTSVYAGEDEHNAVPLRTSFPVVVSASGGAVALDGQTRYVMPWRASSARTRWEVAVLAQWAGVDGD